MSAWLQHPLTLTGSVVELRPLEETLLEELFAVAGDQELWRLTSVNYSDRAVFDASFNTALRDRHLGHVYPFAVCLRDSGRIVGTTRFMDIQPQDARRNSSHWRVRAPCHACPRVRKPPPKR